MCQASEFARKSGCTKVIACILYVEYPLDIIDKVRDGFAFEVLTTEKRIILICLYLPS